MFERSEYKQTLGLILVTALFVLEYAVPTDADGSIVVDKLAALSDKFPNKILDWDLNDMKPWRRALRAILAQKLIYTRLKLKYKKKIRKNKKMQRKYRTIVPVSIVPSILAASIYNRDRHSEYYLVGADDTKEPDNIKIPKEFNEIPDDPKFKNAMKYQHN